MSSDSSISTGKINTLMQQHVTNVFEKLRPYYGLNDQWQVQIVNSPLTEDEGRACCEAEVEYSSATIKLDFNRLRTGDDVEELLCHELVHIPLGWLHEQAWQLAGLAGNLLKPTHQCNATVEYLKEQVRVNAEKSATDIGWVVLRMFRRIQELEAELQEYRNAQNHLSAGAGYSRPN